MERVIEKKQFNTPLQPKAVRAAAYARVSSGKDAMLHSLSAQISHYSEMIQKHPGWLYVGVYSDEARTGTREDRPGFQRLLQDCKAGKIDLVIVKSISRFARNTVPLLETVRELRQCGVDVFFEEQGIHTMSSEGELMLTVLASYAQEESLSVSENQKWRVRKNFEEGKPWNSTMLGYRNINGTLTVVPEEAAIVRHIFDLYISGCGIPSIVKRLNAEGCRTRYDKSFNRSGVFAILRNYAYTGNLMLQKTFRENHITKRTLVNNGELPMYHARNTHEAIIDIEVFQQAQEIMEERAARYAPTVKKSRTVYPFTSLITCAGCGKHYRRKVTKTGPVWICPTFNDKGKTACPSKQIPEAALIALTEEMDMSRIAEITADNGNRLIFRFEDGQILEKRWADRSRSESWTEEMRKKAGEQTKARHEKCRKEM